MFTIITKYSYVTCNWPLFIGFVDSYSAFTLSSIAVCKIKFFSAIQISSNLLLRISDQIQFSEYSIGSSKILNLIIMVVRAL